MNIFKISKSFKDDESGAVTVDWVVLTAAIVGLGIAVLTTVTGGVTKMGENITTQLNKSSMVGAGTKVTMPE